MALVIVIFVNAILLVWTNKEVLVVKFFTLWIMIDMFCKISRRNKPLWYKNPVKDLFLFPGLFSWHPLQKTSTFLLITVLLLFFAIWILGIKCDDAKLGFVGEILQSYLVRVMMCRKIDVK